MAHDVERVADVIAFPSWRRAAASTSGLDGADAGTVTETADRADNGEGACVQVPDPRQCMAELVAMLAAEGQDVVAFARAVPPRFRGRLPTELRLAAGLPVPLGAC